MGDVAANPYTGSATAPPDHLPFNEKMQAAVLGHAFYDPTFFVQCVAKVKPQWFEKEYHRRIWSAVLEFHGRFHRRPEADEMLALGDLRAEDPAFKAAFKAALIYARDARADYGVDMLRGHMADWMQSVIFHRMIGSAAAEHKQGRGFNKAVDVVRQGIRALDEATFEVGEAYDFTRWEEHLQTDERELDGALTTGLPAIDRILTPQARHGSLLRGDMTLIMAPIHGGKTSTISTICAANARDEKDVLLITHEGRANEIRNRLLCALMSQPAKGIYCTNETLRDAHRDPKLRARLQFVANEILTKYLVFVPLVKAGISVEETMAAARRAQDEHQSRFGRKFRLIACDYPGKETTEQARMVKMEYRQTLAVVYNNWSMLAPELDVHTLVAHQTNRDGFKINKGRKGSEDRLLDLDDSGECFAVSQPAANVLTCNLDPITRYMTYLAAKTRSNERRMAITCVTRLSSGLTHHPDLGGLCYEGSGHLGSRTEDFLQKYRDQEIPKSELHGF